MTNPITSTVDSSAGRLYSVTEFAALLGTTPAVVDGLIASGHLPAFQADGDSDCRIPAWVLTERGWVKSLLDSLEPAGRMEGDKPKAAESPTRPRQDTRRPPEPNTRAGNGTPSPLVKRLFTVREAAVFLGTTPAAIYMKVWRGIIPALRDHRRIRIERRDLDAYIAGRMTPYAAKG